MPNKVRDESNYPFPNFNGCTMEVWEWTSNSAPHDIIDLITLRQAMIVQAHPRPVYLAKSRTIYTLWKSNGTFFGTIFCLDFSKINIVYLIWLERSTDEAKKYKISKHCYEQKPSHQPLKMAWSRFCDIKFGRRTTTAAGLFHYEMHNFTTSTIYLCIQMK